MDTTVLPTLSELHELAALRARYGAPHERTHQARLIAAELTKLAHALVNDHVSWQRRIGHSWASVAAGLGVSRQAARQRFDPFARQAARARPHVPRVGVTAQSGGQDDEARAQARVDFERFNALTSASRHVIGVAFGEADGQGRSQVDPLDLLVGLSVSGLSHARELLESVGLAPDRLRPEVLLLRLRDPPA
jgi:hypothetical protein